MPYSQQDAVNTLISQGRNPSEYDLDSYTDALNNPSKYPQAFPQQSQQPLTSPQAQSAPGQLETAARVGGRSIIPTLGAGAGWAGGGLAAASLGLAPESMGASLLLPAAASLVGGWLAGRGQEAALKGIQGDDAYQSSLTKQQAGEEANPITGFVAGVAPQLLLGRPGLGLDVANRLKGAAITGGSDLASQALNSGQPWSISEALKSTGAGALFNKPQLLGNLPIFGGTGGQHTDYQTTTPPVDINNTGYNLTGPRLPEGPQLPGGLLTDPRRMLGASTSPSLGTIPLGAPAPIINRSEDFIKAKANDLQQVMQDNQIGGNPLNPIVEGVNPQKTFTKGVEAANDEVAKAGLLTGEDEEGNSLYQRNSKNVGLNGLLVDNPDFIKHTQDLADKMGITVNHALSLKDANGNEVAGAAYIKDRIVAINPEKAGLDTGLHELNHIFFRDMQASDNPMDRALINQGIALHGSEEAAVEHLGISDVKKLQQEALDTKKPAGWVDKSLAWVKNMWQQIKLKFGNASTTDIAQMLQRRRESFYENPEHAIGKTGDMNDPLLQQGKNKNNYIGVVDSYGAIKARELNEYSNPFSYEHAYDVPGADSRSGDRWRYTNNGKINWSDEPTIQSKEAVENFLSKKGIIPKLHQFGGGIPEDTLFQHKSTLTNSSEEDKSNPLLTSKINTKPTLESSSKNVTPKHEMGEPLEGSKLYTKPDSLVNKLFGSTLDKARATGSGYLADKFSKVFEEAPQHTAQVLKDIPGLDKLNYNEAVQLTKVFQAQRNQGEDLTRYLPPKLQAIAQQARTMYDNKATRQAEAGRPIIEDGEGRDTIRDPLYFSQFANKSVINELTKNPDSDAAKGLRNDWYQHFINKGYNVDTITKKLNDFLGSFKANVIGGANHTSFGANRLPEGDTLPDTWQEPDFRKNITQYATKVGKDFAWRDNIENDPQAAKQMGYKVNITKDPATGVYVKNDLTNTPGEATTNSHIKAAFDYFNGQHSQGEEVANSIGRVATSLFLGPATAIHIAVSTPLKLAGLISPSETPGFIKSLFDVKKGIDDGIVSGIIKRDISSVGSDFMEIHSTAADNLNSLASFITKITGRQSLSRFSQGQAQSAGEYIARLKAMQARQGDTKAIDFLSKLDPTFNYKNPPNADQMIKLGGNITNLAHGAYDPRTMPQWMLNDGFVAPFFKLASWNIAQTNHFMKYVWEPATTYASSGGKKGDYVPLIMSTLGGVLGGAFIKAFREKITDREGPIPTVNELVNSTKGVEGNMPIAAYQAMAAASYAGFAGVLSSFGKAAFDVYYKNKPQGAVFPLDELVSSTASIGSNYFEAMMRGDGSRLDMTTHALMDFFKQNVQMSRIAFNYLGEAGATTNLQQKYKIATANRNLRSYQEVEGLPYNKQEEDESNPYLEVGQKIFKQETDPSKAAQELPNLIHDIFNRYGNQGPEVLRNRLEALKINNYRTMPNPESEPFTSIKYLNFVRKTQGTDAANNLLQDYVRQNLINKVKGAMVPSF